MTNKMLGIHVTTPIGEREAPRRYGRLLGLYNKVLQVHDEAVSVRMFTYHTSSATKTMHERHLGWLRQSRSCRVQVFD